MRVRWRLAKARHAAISFEVVEWSEQLRPVTSVWLGAVRRSVQVRLCTSGCISEKMFGIIIITSRTRVSPRTFKGFWKVY